MNRRDKRTDNTFLVSMEMTYVFLPGVMHHKSRLVILIPKKNVCGLTRSFHLPEHGNDS